MASAPGAGAAGLPAVTAVVLNWCGEDDTRACVESLLAEEYPALEILLVDNGSPDGSGERLHRRFPTLPYLQTGANLGYTGGNNRGIEYALERGAEYVLVLNNDTLVEPGCVRRLVEAALACPSAGAVGPKIVYESDPNRVWFGGGEFSWLRATGLHRNEGEPDRDPQGAEPQRVTFLTGCCLLLPAAAIRDVGAFEEDFFAYAEDVDLSLRLRRGGYDLLYQPGARIRHRVELDQAPPSPFQIFHRDRNRNRLARRRYGLWRYLGFSCWFYPSRAARALQYLAQGDRARAHAIWRAVRAR